MHRIAPLIGLSPAGFAQLAEKMGPRKLEFNPVSDEQFQFLSDLKCFAILEMIKLKNFSSVPEDIARRLDCHIEEVRYNLDLLEKLGFILIDKEDGKIVLLRPNNSWTNNQYSTEAKRKLQNTILAKAKLALNEIDFSQRDQGSLTVAINKNRLPEFKAKLTQIRRELDDYFQDGGEFDEVYQLSVSFFPLTKQQGEDA